MKHVSKVNNASLGGGGGGGKRDHCSMAPPNVYDGNVISSKGGYSFRWFL